jgi:hypothetical protein
LGQKLLLPQCNSNGRFTLVSGHTGRRSWMMRAQRDAIYSYLTAVFDLVAWWAAERRALERAHKALRLRHINPFENEEPIAVVIRCTADREKVDKRTRSKWSRALRYALVQKTPSESLVQFIKRKGGINRCAERFRAHQRGRPSRLLSSK